MNKNLFISLLFSFIFVGCNRDAFFSDGILKLSSSAPPNITSVAVVNNQLIVTGTNLGHVTDARVEGPSNHHFTIESKSPNKLVLNASSAFSFLVGMTFNLFIADAHSSAVFPLSFDLQNGQVTATKLHHMGATAGQVLRYNGTTWTPSTLASSQIYTGTYNASTDSPDIVAAGGPAGTYYIVTTAGTQDLGSGPLTFAVGDWVMFDGTNWSRIPIGGYTVSSFNGRTGIVVPLASDYTWSMLTKAAGKLSGSKLAEIEDINTTGIQNGDILRWDLSTSKWIPGQATSVTAGSITSNELGSNAVNSSKITDGSIVDADISATAAIAQSKILNLVNNLATKEPSISAGTTGQFWRGDKSWSTLDTSVVPENGNLYFLESRVRSALLTGYSSGSNTGILATDSLLTALGK